MGREQAHLESWEDHVSHMDRRRALKLLAALGAAGVGGGALAACGGGSDADDTTEPRSDTVVRIGLLVPQTGGYKTIGDDIVNGFQLYLDLHQGRLGGHPVDLVTADEGETDKTGRAGLTQLLDKGVLAVSGVVSSTVMLAIRDAIFQAKVPLVGSNASPVTLQGNVYIWRTSYLNNECGQAMGPYVASQVKGKVLTVAPNYPAGLDAIDGFQDKFGPRGKLDDRLIKTPVLANVSSSPGKGAFAGMIDQIRSADPEAVFAFFVGPAAVEFLREFKAARLGVKLYAAGFMTEGPALAELQGDAEGIKNALNYSADLPNVANRVFAAAYRKAHGASPTTYAMASYDAAQVLDKAILLAGENPTAQQINLMLGKVGQVDSPRGIWQFNQSRTPQQKWYLREVKRDGPVLSNVVISELSTLG
jgi:branched-chain amino acid transport system substrate-binding protein